MATISAWVDDMVGVAGMYLFLRTAAGVLVNAGGDVLVDAGGTGLFAADVSQDLTGLGTLRARICNSIDEDDVLESGWLAEGSVIVRSEYPVEGGLTEEQAETLEEILTRVSSVSITTTGYAQVDAEGVLQLKQGHTATLTFTSVVSNIVADLTSATVIFGIKDTAGRQWLQVAGTVVTPTGLQSVSFAIPADKAAAMYSGHHTYDVICLYGYSAESTEVIKYTSLQIFSSGNTFISRLNMTQDLL